MEQKKKFWDVKWRQAVAVQPGRWKWMKQMTQVRSKGQGGKPKLKMWFGKLCLNGDNFPESSVHFPCYHRGTILSNTPHASTSSKILLHPPTPTPVFHHIHREGQRPFHSLWGPVWSVCFSMSFGGLGKSVHISEELYAKPFFKFYVCIAADISCYRIS